jgi:hypothetical protein
VGESLIRQFSVAARFHRTITIVPNNDRAMTVHRTKDYFRAGLMLQGAVDLVAIIVLLLLLLSQPLRCHPLATSRHGGGISDILVPTAQGALHLDLVVIFRVERVWGTPDTLLFVILPSAPKKD